MSVMENPFNLIGGPYTPAAAVSGGVEDSEAVQREKDRQNALQVQANADREAAARDAAQRAAEAAVRAADEASRVQNATKVMEGILAELNLGSLYTRVVDFIKEGYDPQAIQILIRTTPEYKNRFPAMDALAAKGRTISEADYIGYEKTAAGLERRYGLPDGMLMSNITTLLTNEVSRPNSMTA